MSTATFKILYRPVKIGFLIDENNINDVVKAAEMNTMLWGGIYNPIIPVTDEKKYTKQIFENFEIDILYDLSKSEKTTAFIDEYPYLKPHTGSMKEIFLDYNKQFGYVDVGNLLTDPTTTDKVKNTILYKFDQQFKYSNLLKVLHGFFPEIEKSDFDFRNGFIEILKPEIKEITNETVSAGIFHNLITPINFTGFDIGQYGSLKDHYNLRNSNNSIFIGSGNSFDDLVYYWNLRAYGYNLYFYSVDDENFFNENVEDFIKQFDKSESDSPHHPESSVFFREQNAKYFDVIRNKMKNDPFYCQLHNSYLGILRYDQPFGYFKNGSHDALGHISEPQSGGYRVSLSLPNMPFSKNESRNTSKQYFISTINPEAEPFYKYTFNVPYVPELNEFYSRKIVKSILPFDLRCEPSGIGTIINNEKRTLNIQPVLFREILFEMFRLAGFDPKQSQAGLLTIKIINKLGHIDSCRVFKIRGVRKVIRSLKIADTITRSKIEQDIYDNGNFKAFQDLYIEQRSQNHLTQRSVVDFLFRNDFFRAGLELSCASCNLENWLPVKRLDDFWTCEFCGHSNQLNIALKDRGDWKFRRSGLFGKDNNQEGAVPVILTLMQLYRCLQGISTKHTMIYETATTLSGPRECEIDFSVLNVNDQDDFELGFGECKDEGGQIDSNDIDNLKFVYDIFKRQLYKPYIIIAKASDTFTKEEIALFQKTKLEGYRLILFTNTELEHYGIADAYRGKLKLPRDYPSSLSDLHWNSDFIYLKEEDAEANQNVGTMY